MDTKVGRNIENNTNKANITAVKPIGNICQPICPKIYYTPIYESEKLKNNKESIKIYEKFI